MGEFKGVGMVGEVLGEVGLVDDLDHAGLGLLCGVRGVGPGGGGGRAVNGPGSGVRAVNGLAGGVNGPFSGVVDGPFSGVVDGPFSGVDLSARAVDVPGSLLVTLWKEV